MKKPNPPALSTLPAVLAYIDRSLEADSDDRLLAARFADAPDERKAGVEWINTILVPLDNVEGVLQRVGGLHIDYSRTLAIPGPGLPLVDSIRDGRERYEVLAPSWLNHNIRVFLAAPSFLRAYQLVPRSVANGTTWDDPRLPVHDVVTIQPNSTWDMSRHTTAEVWIKRSYAEDYASARECALVSVYWLERYFYADEDIERLMAGTDGIDYSLPGKTIYLRRMIFIEGQPVLVQASGVKLLLWPQQQPISGDNQLSLHFPDVPFALTSSTVHDLDMLHEVYAHDEFLVRFQDRDDYEIHPQTASVSHGGHWGLSYTSRVGRDYVAVETRKLFEGCPDDIIRHFHSFAVPPAAATQQRGQSNIGARAKLFVSGFFDLVDALSDLAAVCGVSESVCVRGRHDIDYYGWWKIEPFRGIGNVALRTMTQKDFVIRCIDLRAVFDLLNENALRAALRTTGFDLKNLPDGAGTFLLIGALAREGRLSERTGLSPSDGVQFFKRMDVEVPKVEELNALLGINDFRTAAAHRKPETQREFRRGCETLGIDPKANAVGWGTALDHVLDSAAASLTGLTNLLRVLEAALTRNTD